MYKDITEARAAVRQLLPQFLHRVMQSYEDYITMPGMAGADEPKQYGAYHTGAKAALTHLDLLLRMEKIFGTTDSDADVAEDDAKELAAAYAELHGLQHGEAGDA